MGEQGDHLGGRIVEIDILEVERERTAFDARQIEQIVDECEQMPARVLDALQARALFGQQGFALVAGQQLRESENAVERGAQLMAHARQEFRLGAACALGRFLGTQCLFGLAFFGDVPIHADELERLTGFVELHHAARGQPAHRAIGPMDAEFGLVGLAPADRARLGCGQQRPVFLEQRGVPDRLRIGPQLIGHAEQGVHLRAPDRCAGAHIVLPDADAGRAGRELQPVHRLGDGPLGHAPVGHVPVHAHHADRLPVVVAVDGAAREQMAHLPIGSDDAKCRFVGRAVACRAQHVVERVVGVARMHERIPGFDRGVLPAVADTVDLAQLLVPDLLVGEQVPVPDAQVGGRGGQTQAVGQTGEFELGLGAFGDVDHHTEDAGHAARGVALRDAPGQQMAHLAARAAALHAAFGADRLSGLHRALMGRDDGRTVVGVDQVAHRC